MRLSISHISKLSRRQRLFKLIISVLIVIFVSNSFPKRPTKRPSPSSSHAPRLNFAGRKLLYIVTTLAEYDNGRRMTTKGYDRLRQTFIPVLRESVESLISFGFQVDVVVIAHYNMTRSHLLRHALPSSVGIQIWDRASPLGYRLEEKNGQNIDKITRALARQHRFVIKDKLPYYDFFCAFEDDMLIKGDAVENYIDMVREINRLQDLAPDINQNQNYDEDNYYGVLNKRQLSQLIPGFIRVEALLDSSLLNKKKYQSENLIPITERPNLDSVPCCHLNNTFSASDTRPLEPDSDTLYFWETNVRALGIRKMPLQTKFDWVLLQRGRRILLPDAKNQRWNQIDVDISDYWTGRDGYFESSYERPDTKMFEYLNNQGGWMATRKQIWDFHTSFCNGGFLPPFDDPHFRYDGLDLRNVEYWSGGLNLFTMEHACNLQRIISLDPERFARQLLYHTANNKQRHLMGKKRIKFTNVNDFLGQLNTVKLNAQAEMARRVNAMRQGMQN